MLCFNCFEKFKPHEVWFRCINASSKDENPTSGCVIEIDAKLKVPARRAFPLHGYLAQLAALTSEPLSCKCDKCPEVSNRRICPHCHRDLFVGQGQLPEHIIAIVGNTNSGKSHYFTVLIERAIRGAIGDGFGAAMDEADDATIKLYMK